METVSRQYENVSSESMLKILSFLVRILRKVSVILCSFSKCALKGGYAAYRTTVVPLLTSACLPGLNNHFSAADPQTVYFLSLKFP